jgi:3-hydroxypropanoate dehydrogenase
MSAVLLRLDAAAHSPRNPAPLERSRLGELHALLALDSIAGASPARTLFVVSEANKARLALGACPSVRERILGAPACAVVGYDFPFAVNLVLSGQPDDGVAATALAIRTAARSAALQGEALARAAAALGLVATPFANFDAAALKAGFFAGTEATVVFVCRLDPDPASDRAGAIPLIPRSLPCPKPLN